MYMIGQLYTFEKVHTINDIIRNTRPNLKFLSGRIEVIY